MLRSCLIVIHGSCLLSCAALRDDFGAACWPGLVACGLCLRQSECGNAQCVCAVYSPGDDCTFREQRQKARSCAADTVLAAQQDTARLLGVVLIIGVNRRYSLLGVSERRVLLDVSQSVTPFD
jgi:hypothetical protein